MSMQTPFVRLPAGVGARGAGFEIKEEAGIPFLVENGLPFQTFFDADNRERVGLNGTWRFREDPRDRGLRDGWQDGRMRGEAEPVEVPSVFNAAASGRTTYLGPVWYARGFTVGGLPRDGRLLLLRFDGVLMRAAVWLNGKRLGGREGGYGSFALDTAGTLNLSGENVLVVRVDNRLTPFSLPPLTWKHHRAGWHTYGGIYRDIALESLRLPYVFKVECTAAPQVSGAASMRVRVLTHAAGSTAGFDVACTLSGPDGEPVGRATASTSAGKDIDAFTFDFAVPHPRLYAPSDPALYKVVVSAGKGGERDEVQVLTGIRSIRVQGETLLLNDESLFLKGICKHEDDPILGATQTPASISRDLDLIAALGANYIRMTHYAHAAKEVAAARDRGLLMSEEIANYKTGAGFVEWFSEKGRLRQIPLRWLGKRQTMARRFLLNAQKELAELIERDRNNPAVILWYVGNETWDLFHSGARACAWLRDVARALDPNRPVSMAELTYNRPAFDRRRQGSAFMDVVSVNLYSGWYYGSMEDAAGHLDRLHAAFPGRPLIVSEFGADAAPGRHDEDGEWRGDKVPAGRTYSEDYQARLLESYAEIIRRRPYIVGMAPWVFSDFYCPEFPANPVPFFNLKGIVSGDRTPKQGYESLRRIYRSAEGK